MAVVVVLALMLCVTVADVVVVAAAVIDEVGVALARAMLAENRRRNPCRSVIAAYTLREAVARSILYVRKTNTYVLCCSKNKIATAPSL